MSAGGWVTVAALVAVSVPLVAGAWFWFGRRIVAAEAGALVLDVRGGWIVEQSRTEGIVALHCQRCDVSVMLVNMAGRVPDVDRAIRALDSDTTCEQRHEDRAA